MGIETRTRTVFFAPTAGRHFFTRRAAINKEAAALVMRKYPTEKPDYYEDMRIDDGFHWTEDPRLVRLHARLVRILSRHSKDT